MSIEKKLKILEKVLNDNKYPNKTELKYENPYQLLIAVMMSAQTTDKQVNKINKKFFKILKKPEDAIKLGEEKIKEYIKSIGLYNNKAKNIFKTSKIIIEKYNGQIPSSLKKLMELPGVGIKTAKVVLATLYNAPYLPVDTHVHRVLNRLGIVKTNNALETDKEISKLLMKNANIKLHNNLIFFGRYFCTAKNPKCNICQLRKICNFYNNK